MGGILIIALLVLSFMVLRPLIIPMIMALILAFIFSPVQDWLVKRLRSKNLSASLIVVFLLMIIVLPIWFLTPVLMRQSLSIFGAVQNLDFIGLLESTFPRIFSIEGISSEIGYSLGSLTTRAIDAVISSLTELIINFPVLLLQLTVVFFTFFFVLRDREVVIEYIKGILPFPKDVETKLFKYTKDITNSILFGQLLTGIVQGVVLGLGIFIFGIPNALFLTLVAMLAGIMPVIGTFFVWIPLAIFLFIQGDMLAMWGIIVFGTISSNIDNFLRPIIVAKRTEIHMAIVLVSMIGGLFYFGVLGLILGPLIISYLLIFLELSRGKKKPEIIIKPSENK